MKTSEFRNEQSQIDEGPCDVATRSDIKKMSADVFSKYARWKKECEENESKHSTADDEAELARMFDENEVEEGHRTLPAMDTERYTERKGLEGPMRARNGKVVYYDPKEGQYYDPDTDIYISNEEWEAMNESSPGWDGPEYKKGDLIVAQNGQSYILDEYDDGVWFAVGDDGEEHEFVPGTELHHEPMSESVKPMGFTLIEDDGVSNALDTMRNHLNDYSHDPSDRWEKYNQYRDERRQISQRAKDVTEWGNSHLDQQIAKQADDDKAEKSDKKWKKNFDKQSAKRRGASNRRQQQQADEI